VSESVRAADCKSDAATATASAAEKETSSVAETVTAIAAVTD
jgi:hypothetical protein